MRGKKKKEEKDRVLPGGKKGHHHGKGERKKKRKLGQRENIGEKCSYPANRKSERGSLFTKRSDSKREFKSEKAEEGKESPGFCVREGKSWGGEGEMN